MTDLVKEKSESNEGHKSIPDITELQDIKNRARFMHHDSYPMQESMSVEQGEPGPLQQSVTGLGFQTVSEKDAQSETWSLGERDLIKFSVHGETKTKVSVLHVPVSTTGHWKSVWYYRGSW